MNMKKFHFLLISFAALLLGGCTLYLDDEQEDLIRTADGYVEPETIELDDDKGTVTYKYNQHTIAIDDEVESYVATVQNDSIVYFVDGTPDDILPEVGEMLVCSFRDKFPNGFCRRVVSQTKENGLYKCVTEPCDLFDAFDELQVNYVTRNEAELGGKEISAQEYFEGVGEEETQTNDPSTNLTRGVTRGWDDFIGDINQQFGNGKLVEFELAPEFGIKGGGNTVSVSGSIKAGGSISFGPIVVIKIDSKSRTKEISIGLAGGVKFFVTYKVAGNVHLEPPVSIPILGAKFDIKIFGANLGVTATPFVEFEAAIEGEISIAFTTGGKIGYFEKDGKGTFDFAGLNVGKRPGNPVITNTMANPDVTLRASIGVDFQLGIGANAADGLVNAEASAGLKVFASVSHKFSLKDFASPDMYKGKTLDIDVKGQSYAGIEGGAFIKGFAGLSPTTKNLWHSELDWWPTVDTYYFYKSNLEKNEYSAGFSVADKGILGWVLSLHDKSVMRIYDEGNLLVEEIPLKPEGGMVPFKPQVFSGKKVSTKLKDNTKYYAQPVMSGSNKYNDSNPSYMDMDKFEVMTTLPGIEITDIKVIQNTKGTLPVMYSANNIVYYKYCYTLRTKVKITDTRNCRKWGIMLRNDKGQYTTFETDNNVSTTGSVSPTVEWKWYSNKKSLTLAFTPYVLINGAEGKQMFTEKSIDIKFDESLTSVNQSIADADYKANGNEY